MVVTVKKDYDGLGEGIVKPWNLYCWIANI